MNEKRSVAEQWKDVGEVFAVVLLALTAVLTAWCGFEASKWSGAMSISFSQASSARITSSSYEGEARDNRMLDLSIYTEWLQAEANGEAGRATYVEDRFRPEFAVAFDAWRAEGMKEPSPFTRDEYVPTGQVEAETYSNLADEKFQTALVDNQRGDNYSILTVLFALVLFFTAVSQRNDALWSRWFLLGLAAAAAIVAIVILATLPLLI